MAAFSFCPNDLCRLADTIVDALAATVVPPVNLRTAAIVASIDALAFAVESPVDPVALAIQAI